MFSQPGLGGQISGDRCRVEAHVGRWPGVTLAYAACRRGTTNVPRGLGGWKALRQWSSQ
jgi:hypothetical protein